MSTNKPRKKSRVLAVFLTLLVVGAFTYVGIRWVTPRYDELVRQREEVRKEWAQVDALLQRRFNLIPNLVRTVKGYAGHEASLIKEVADSHTGYLKARSRNARIKAAYKVERSIGRCMIWGMRFPRLKADTTFLSLMRSLEGAEDAVARQRMAYNSAVATLNTNVNSAFGGLVAGLSDIEEAAYYNPPKAAAEVPRVDFSESGGSSDSSGASAAQPALKKPALKKPAPLSVRDLNIVGLVRQGSRADQAILRFPDGSTRVVRRGQSILELRARVESIDASGVTFEELTIKPDGRSVRRRVRVTR